MLKQCRPRILLDLWKQVLVAFLLFEGLVTHPGVDEPLVDASARANRRETVTQAVPA